MSAALRAPGESVGSDALAAALGEREARGCRAWVVREWLSERGERQAIWMLTDRQGHSRQRVRVYAVGDPLYEDESYEAGQQIEAEAVRS